MYIMKKSFIVANLNLEVSEKLNNKLVKAEAKLADAVVSNHKVKEKRGTIVKILKENNVKVDTKELKGCLTEFETSVKLLGVEFSITRNENLTINPTPDLMFEERYNIDLSDIDEVCPAGEIIDADYVEIVDETSPEDDNESAEESISVYEFVYQTMGKDSNVSEMMNSIRSMFQNNKEISNVVYNIIRGDVPFAPIAGRYMDLAKENMGEMTYRLISPFLNAIIETIVSAIYDLNILSSADDKELITSSYDRYEKFLSENIDVLLYAMDDMNKINSKEFVSTILGSMLSPSYCKEFLGLEDKDIYKLTVEDAINILFGFMNKDNDSASNETTATEIIVSPKKLNKESVKVMNQTTVKNTDNKLKVVTNQTTSTQVSNGTAWARSVKKKMRLFA